METYSFYLTVNLVEILRINLLGKQRFAFTYQSNFKQKLVSWKLLYDVNKRAESDFSNVRKASKLTIQVEHFLMKLHSLDEKVFSNTDQLFFNYTDFNNFVLHMLHPGIVNKNFLQLCRCFMNRQFENPGS